jgi:hypothetical protein
MTIRAAICYYYRLTIVAAQQDCKRPFSLAPIVLMSVAAIIIGKPPEAAGHCIRAQKRA